MWHQAAAVGEVVLAVGSSWGPDNLSEAQLQHVLAELTQRLAAQQADATVLRTRFSLKPGAGERPRARGTCFPGKQGCSW